MAKRVGTLSAMMASAAVALGSALPAHADDAAPAYTAASARSVADVEVPLAVSPELSAKEADIAATLASGNNGQVVAYFGTDQKKMAAIWDEVQKAIFEGKPVKLMLVASPVPEKKVNGYTIVYPEQLRFYADGVRTNIIENPGAETATFVREELADDYKNVILRPVGISSPTASYE